MGTPENGRARGPAWIESSRLRFIAALTVAATIALAGCQSPPPSVEPERDIAAALDTAGDITFRAEGGPIDEPAGATDTLSLDEAMRRCIASDPSIQSALARVRIALADAQQARLLPNPVLNLALRWPEGGGSPIIEASLAQDVVSLLMRPRRSSAADNRLREACADAVTVAIDVAAALQERYATVQSLDELLPVLHRQRDLMDRLIALSQSRLDAGEGTRDDVTVLQAQRVELDVDIAAAELDRNDQRLQLARQIGEPSSAAAWTLDSWTPPSAPAGGEVAWIDAGLAHRPEIMAIRWRLAALGDELSLAKLRPWEDGSAGAQAERDGDWSIGPEVSVPLPIFDMGQAQSARVRAETIEARHELTQVSRQVVEDVRRAHQSLARTESNLRRVREELIPLQQQRRTQAEASFRAGQSDVTPLFLAEQDLLAAQARAADFERQTAVAMVRLQRAVGGVGVAMRVGHDATPDMDSTTHARGASPDAIQEVH